MKILHIASFNGNIGDNAHHNGFYKNFQKLLKKNIEWTNLEIRNFYKSWNKMKFDSNFVKFANQFDLLIIGGGNFFEICHEYSSTGTTIDISIDNLKKIKTPIFFNALGFDIHKGYTEETKERFKVFIDYLLENKNKYFITFRNDGSKKNYEKLYKKLPDDIHIIPDGGFFLKVSSNKIKEENKRYIGVNLACDMLEKRLKKIEYSEFCRKISHIYIKFLDKNPNYKILFFPHIYSDYKIIFEIISHFDDINIKYNIEVAPYFTGQGSEIDFFKFYKKCNLITGMRFHTNVCAIAINIPTIAMGTYPKLLDLYTEINLQDRIIDVNEKDFFEKYYIMLEDSITNNSNLKKIYKKTKNKLSNKKTKKYYFLKQWLDAVLKLKN